MTEHELNQKFIVEIANSIFLHKVERTFPNGEAAIAILSEAQAKLRNLLDEDHRHKAVKMGD